MRLSVFLIVLWLAGCSEGEHDEVPSVVAADTAAVGRFPSDQDEALRFIEMKSDVPVSHYFEAIDSLCAVIDSAFGIQLSEYELVHANQWILDTLMSFDYYKAKEQGRVIDDQKNCTVLKVGDELRVPIPNELDAIRTNLNSVLIDVNIPEFTLRIWQNDSLVYACPVRVGKNERKFLALARHEVDLRTPIGDGHIVRIERNPLYINPVDGHRYKTTRRDDGSYTQLPRIPFLEPEINGIRSGALMHPTTNRSTLGKAVSNGCVGLSEADAWMVYYHAPRGTRVRFRYDLEVTDSTGRHRTLDDIYQKNTSSR
jgi:L,D-transpeptidase ErfK/SrfK